MAQAGYVCFNIISTSNATPPEVCMGEICIEFPHCDEAKTGERADKQLMALSTAMGDYILAPNPAFESVTLFTRDAQSQPSMISVYDVMGQVKLTLIPTNLNTVIDLRNIPTGLYTVVMTDVNGIVSSKKLVVIR